MAAVHNLGFSNFLIFKFFIVDRVGTSNVQRHTNFIKVGEMVDEILHLTTVKITAICHLGFLKI